MQTRPAPHRAPARRGGARPGAAPGARAAGAAALALLLLGGGALPAWSAPSDQRSGTETVVGTLIRAAAEGGLALGTSGELAWIEDGTDAGVRVDAADVADVPSGARVEALVGAEVPGTGASLTPAREVLSAEVLPDAPGERSLLAGVPDAPGPAGRPVDGQVDGQVDGLAAAITPARHDVAVVMAVPAGAQRGTARLADVVAAVDDATDDFWSSQTDGAVRFSVAATRDDVALSASCRDPRALWAEAAAAVGFRGGANQHLLVYVGEDAPGCAAGLGTVGSGVGAGGVTYVTQPTMSIIAHELGHNMGLSHSGKLQCPGTPEASGAGSCAQPEYLDFYDVMAASWGPTGSLNPVQAHQIGVLAGARGADVPPAGGRFTLSPVGGGAGLRAVRLADAAGATYWVELREPVGRDAYLASPRLNHVGLDAGVLVRSAASGQRGATSLLLDATPSPAAGWDRDFTAALAPGRSLLVAGGRWRLTVDASSGAGADRRASVSITPAAPGASTAPDGTLTGAPDVAPPTGNPAPGPNPTSNPSPAPPRPGPPATPPPAPRPEPLVPAGAVSRHEGASRYSTAVAVSRASHPGPAPTVVVASGEAFPDALAAGPVAAAAGGPLLLVPRDGAVPAEVLAELRRLAPERVVLAGGRGAVSDAVAAQLAGLAPVQRVVGADRFETAARLAGASGQRGGTVYLASGATHADAVAGGALAAHDGSVVLLSARDALPAATRDALAAIRPERVVVLGGPASVGLAPVGELARVVPEASVVRLGGADRYDTAAQVADAGYPDGAARVYLASGDAFADALAGGPAAGAEGAPLLLTGRSCVPGATVAAVRRLAPESVVVLGGPSAVGADALRPC